VSIKVIELPKELRVFSLEKDRKLKKTGMFLGANQQLVVGEAETFKYKDQYILAIPVLDLAGFYILNQDISPENWVRQGSEIKEAVLN